MFENQDSPDDLRHGYSMPRIDQYPPLNVQMYAQNTAQNYNLYFQQNFNYALGPSYDTNFGRETVPVVNLEMRKNDEQVIENFLKENEQTDELSQKRDYCGALRISEVKSALISIHKLNKELELFTAELRSNKSLPEPEWQEKLEICQGKKIEILNLLKKFRDKEFINNVKKELEKRKKKRLREKRKRAAWKIEKTVATEKRAQLHIEADIWIKNKQEVIEKEKQEENLRKDADMVLADVRAKRSDARKFLGILQELQNLRRVKVNVARARGEHLSSAADEAFNNIIVKLVEQWTALDREYSIEEQGLRLMLKTDNERKIEKQKKNTFDDWENVFFGRKLPTTDLFQRDLQAFVTIRAAWDKFINYDGEGSPIPIGWVVPDVPSSAAWQKYLKKE